MHVILHAVLSLSGRLTGTTLIRDFLATPEEEPGIAPSTIIRHTQSTWEGRTAGKLAWISKAIHKVLTFGTPWICRRTCKISSSKSLKAIGPPICSYYSTPANHTRQSAILCTTAILPHLCWHPSKVLKLFSLPRHPP